MTRLLVFGGNSLVGSHFLRATRHPITAAGRTRPDGTSVTQFAEIDLEDPSAIRTLVSRSDAEVLVNFTAATKVDLVETERPSGPPSPEGPAYRINAALPEALAQATRAAKKYLISFSTSFVFDGLRGPYSEASRPSRFSDRVSWYGWTKGVGERLVRTADPTAVIVRIAYPYGSPYGEKPDFARRIADAFRDGTSPPYFDDQQITPTWIPDISRAIERLIDLRPKGVLHLASPNATSPFEFARAVVTEIGGDPSTLRAGSMAEFLHREGATPRPRRGGLLCAKARAAGLKLTTWKDGIHEYLQSGGLA